MGDYDKAARYTARSDPDGFFGWVASRFALSWRFVGWHDTTTLVLPGEDERICDTVAEFVHRSDSKRRRLVDCEFQSRPDPDMLERLAEYAIRLRRQVRHDAGAAGKFLVSSLLLNLTGPPQSGELDMTEPDLDGTGLRLTVPVKTLSQEDAAATLTEIAAGRLSRGMLPWIPLMRGADESSTIEEWKRLAAQEPDRHRRADYGGLAITFAELAGRGQLWKEALEGWNVEESKFLREWRQEGRAEGLEEGREEGLIQGQRTSVLQVLEHRFHGPVPDDVAEAVMALSDLDEIGRWLAAAATADSVDAFREAVQQHVS